MKRRSTDYVKIFVIAILFGASLAVLPAFGDEPCPDGVCRFLGFDDELVISVHSNSALDDENSLRTYLDLEQSTYHTNDNTEKSQGRRVVSSMTVTGKMTVDPLATIKDEVFVVSIIKDNNGTAAKPRDDSSRVNVFCLTPDSGNSEYQSKTLLDLIFSTKDKTESRIGAAVGNLTGDLRDELAIAYENDMGMPELLVLSNDDLNVALEVRQPVSSPGTTALGGGKGIVLAAGNFDGDEYDEIAMLYETNDGVQLEIFQMQLGNLSPAGSVSIDHKKGTYYTDCRNIALSAGDFDGDGNDELLTATIETASLFLSYYEVDLNQAHLSLKADRVKLYSVDSKSHDCWGCPDLRMIAVDRDGDGAEEGILSYSVDEEVAGDIAVLYNSIYSIAEVTIEPSSSNTQLSKISANWLENVERGDALQIWALDLSAVSSFKDEQAGEDYRYVIMGNISSTNGFAIHANNIAGYEHFDYKVPFNGDAITWGDQIHTSWTFSSAAGELDGNGQTLQTGDSFTIRETYQPVLILQTPPQHIDVFEDGVTNISRFSEFNSKFDYEKGVSTLASNSSKAEYGNGVYTDNQIGMKYDRFSVGVKVKANAMWKDAVETQNSTYSGTVLTSQLETTVDDLVRYNSKEVVFWRYPYPTDLGDDKFLQFSLPDAVSESHDVSGALLEYYRPEHENGQLLSYPWFQETQDDVEVLNTGRVITISQGNFQTSLELQSSQSSSTTETTGHTLKTSAGVYFKAGTKEKEPMGPDVSLEAGYQSDLAVQQSSTSETNTYGKEKITIQETGAIVELLAGQSYGIKPLFFRKEGGPIQVSYSVDPDSLGVWWDRYAEAPDVALNLPERWERSSSSSDQRGGASYSYIPNEELSRYRMKGFFVSDKPMSDDSAIQGWGTDVGVSIWLNARIHNYSMMPVSNVKVQFQYQRYDCGTWSERHDIGTVDIAGIPAWGNSANDINWKWAKIEFTPDDDGYYCFWVIVDPDDGIEELPVHDNYDRYNNNAGYWGVPFPVGTEGNEPSLPPDNIAPQWVLPGKKSISVYKQASEITETLEAENPSDPDEILQYAAYVLTDDGSLESLPDWIGVRQAADSETTELYISPANAMNADTLTLELQVSNAITTATKTLKVEVVGEKNDEGVTEIFHYGIHTAYYPLGMQGYECDLYTQALSVDGNEEGPRVKPDLNQDWSVVSGSSEDGWELTIAPGSDTAFWHSASASGTHYAKQKAVVICSNGANADVSAEFHIQVANNPPIFDSKTTEVENIGSLNGTQNQTIVLGATDDTEDILKWSCWNCDTYDFIDFGDETEKTGNTHTITVNPAKAEKMNGWSTEENRLIARSLGVTVSDGLLEKTLSLTITVDNALPPCDISTTDDNDEVIVSTTDDGVIQVTHEGSAITTYNIPLVIPAGEEGETISYELKGGLALLPDWLSFDENSGVFSMMPAKAGDLADTGQVEHRCEVLLSDGWKVAENNSLVESKVSQGFNFVLTNDAPSFTSPTSSTFSIPRGSEWSLTLLADDVDGDLLTYDVRSPLPGWLRFTHQGYRLTESAVTTMEEQKQADLELLREQLESVEQGIMDIEGERDSLLQQKEQYSNEKLTLETEIDEMETGIEELTAEIETLTAEIERLKRLRLVSTQAQIGVYQRQIVQYQEQIEQIRQEIVSKNAKIEQKEQELSEINADIQKLEAQLDKLQHTTLPKLRKKLALEEAALDAIVDQLGSVLPDAGAAQTREELLGLLEAVFKVFEEPLTLSFQSGEGLSVIVELDEESRETLREEYRLRILEASRIPQKAVLEGTPEAGDGGEHEIVLTVSDGIVVAEKNLIVTVDNAPPVFTSIPIESAGLGQEYSYFITASDADSDPLQLRVQEAPDWFTSFGEETQLRNVVGSEEPDQELGATDAVVPSDGAPRLEVIYVPAWEISGTPTVAGNYPVIVTIDDGSGPVEQRFTIVARDGSGNAPPVFSSTLEEWIAEGLEYSSLSEGYDPDGDALTLSMTEGSDWLTLSESAPDPLEIRLPVKADGTARKPYFLAFAPDGTLYVTDSEESVWKVPAGSREPEIFATSCDGTTFKYAYGIDVDKEGRVYVVEKGDKTGNEANGHVCRIEADGSSTELASGLDRPYDVAVDRNGTAYVTAPFAKKLYIIPGGEGAIASVDVVWRPFGVAVDRAGQVFVTDVAGVVRMFDPSKSAWTEFAEGLQSPYGIAIDLVGNVYLAEYKGDQALKMNADGETSTQISNSEHGLTAPYDVALDTDGRLYVTDTANDRILRLEWPSWLLNGVPYNSPEEADDGGQAYPVTLELSDGRSSSIQGFTIFVSSGDWVSFVKDSSCPDFGGKFWVQSERYGTAECHDGCEGFQVLLPPDGLLMLTYENSDACEFVSCKNILGEIILEGAGESTLNVGADDEILVNFQQP